MCVPHASVVNIFVGFFPRRLPAQGGSTIHLQFQRLIVNRAEKVLPRRCDAVAADLPYVVERGTRNIASEVAGAKRCQTTAITGEGAQKGVGGIGELERSREGLDGIEAGDVGRELRVSDGTAEVRRANRVRRGSD